MWRAPAIFRAAHAVASGSANAAAASGNRCAAASESILALYGDQQARRCPVYVQQRSISASAPVYERKSKRQSTTPVYTGLQTRDNQRAYIKKQREKLAQRTSAGVTERKEKKVVVLEDTSLADDFKAIVETTSNRRQGSTANILSFIDKIKRTSSEETMVDDMMLVVALFKIYRSTNSRIESTFSTFLNAAVEMDVPELVCEVIIDRSTYGMWPVTSEYERLLTGLLSEDAADPELACDMLNLAADDTAVLVRPDHIVRHCAVLESELKDADEAEELSKERIEALKELYGWSIYAWGQGADAVEVLNGEDVEAHQDSKQAKTGKLTRQLTNEDVDSMVSCVQTVNNVELTKHVVTTLKKYTSEEQRGPHLDTLLPLVCALEETSSEAA